MRDRLRRRRERVRAKAPRGVMCEERLYTGGHYGARCVYFATGYQTLHDVYVCGVHARAYLRVVPIGTIRAWNEGSGLNPFQRQHPEPPA